MFSKEVIIMADQHNKGWDNLIPMNKRTMEERQELGRKGQIKSVEARRRNKNLKETLMLMLEDEDIQRAISTKLVKEAMEGNQSIKAFEVILASIGLKPSDKIEQTITNKQDLSHLTKEEIKELLDE